MATYIRQRVGKRGRMRKIPTEEGQARIDAVHNELWVASRIYPWAAIAKHYGTYSPAMFHRVVNDDKFYPSEEFLELIESKEPMKEMVTTRVVPCPTCGTIHERVTNGKSMDCGKPKRKRVRLDVTKHIDAGMTQDDCLRAIRNYEYLVYGITELAIELENPIVKSKINRILEDIGE